MKANEAPEQYIPKSVLVAKIKEYMKTYNKGYADGDDRRADALEVLLHNIDTLEVKEVDLMIHTIIAECCDWLVINTNLTHDEIEGCRNLMLTVKEEQFKAQKGEEV